MIKAIFWDIGGVLILSKWKQVLEDWSKRLSTTPDNLRTVLKQFSDHKMKGNDLTYNDFIIKNKIDWVSAEQLENLQQSLWNSEYVNNELLKFIQDNKEKYIYGVITNNYKGAEEVILNKYKVPKFYQYFISSYDIGVLKPNPKIYQYAINLAKIKPEECLFIDDLAENVKGAEAVGMKGIYYTDNEKLMKELQNTLKV